MKIIISVENLKYIYKVCKDHVLKKDGREEFKYIHLDVRNGIATAISLDGYKMAMCEVPVDGDNGSYILPICKPPKVDVCEIENNDISMIIDFGYMKHEELIPDVIRVTDYNKYMPKSDPEITIAFNPDKMIDALKSFKCEYVKMEIRETTDGIVLSKGNAVVMVLPVKVR